MPFEWTIQPIWNFTLILFFLVYFVDFKVELVPCVLWQPFDFKACSSRLCGSGGGESEGGNQDIPERVQECWQELCHGVPAVCDWRGCFWLQDCHRGASAARWLPLQIDWWMVGLVGVCHGVNVAEYCQKNKLQQGWTCPFVTLWGVSP